MDFDYLISFYTDDENLNLEIHITHENNVAPVLKRSYSKAVLTNKSEFLLIINQIKEYFDLKSIKMTKSDLHLFYNTFVELDIALPTISHVSIVADRFIKSDQLSPRELLFLMYIDGKAVNGKIAKYWTKDYHLDINYTLVKLLKDNYLTSQDYKYNLKKATKKELEHALQSENIAYSGSKSEVLQKVLTLSETVLEAFFSGLYCKKTPKGKEACKKVKHLNEFHKSYYRYTNHLLIEEFYLLSKKYDNLDAKEVCKIMIENKDDKTVDFDWDAFFNEVSHKKVKVEDDITRIVNKYSKQEKKDVVKKEHEVVSDEEFLNIVYQTKKETAPRKEKIELKKLRIEERTPENETVLRKKDSILGIFVKRFAISSVMSVVIVYVLYSLFLT